MLRTALFVTVWIGWAMTLFAASPPDRLNYQGVLRDATDSPLNGPHNMTFRFFNAATAGSEILVDQHLATGTGSVTVTGGLFNVILGSGAVTDGSGPGTYTSLSAVFRDHADVWLEVQVVGEVLSPRIRVLATAYALGSDHLDGLDSSGFGQIAGANSWSAANSFTNPSNSFTGSGAGLTALNASNLASGTVPGARISGAHANVVSFTNAGNSFTGSGAGLTALNASSLASGTVPAGRISGTYANAVSFTNAGNSFTGNGAGLTNLTASDLTAGTYANAMSFTNAGNIFAGNGMGLTALNASNLTSGTVPGARISGTYANPVSFTSVANSFSGNGAGLTGVNAANANTLDGIDSLSFLRSDASDTFTTGVLTIAAGTALSVEGFLTANGSIYMDSGGPDGTQSLYFYNAGSSLGEYLRWNDTDDRFEVSDDLRAEGDLTVSGGDLFLGDSAANYIRYDSLNGRFEFGRPLHGPPINHTYLASDSNLRFMFDNDNSTTANVAEWFHDGSYGNASKVAELSELGALRIRSIISQNVAFDIAESFVASEPLEAGDLVRVDPLRPDAVLRTSGRSDRGVLGIVSERPGVILGGVPFDASSLRETWGEVLYERFLARKAELEADLLSSHPDLVAEAVAVTELEARLDEVAGRRGRTREHDGAPAAGRMDADAAESGREDDRDARAPAASPTHSDAADSDRRAGAESAALAADLERRRQDLANRLEGLALEKFFGEAFVPIALAGRVPVKAIGPIEVGDPLGPSPVPGLAMRAEGAGPVIGIALEAIAEARGRVLAYVTRVETSAAGIAAVVERQDRLDEAVSSRTPDPGTGIQVVQGHFQVLLDRGGDDTARFSVFSDGGRAQELRAEVFRVDENGNVYAKGALRPASLDLAEFHPVAEPVEAGDVLVADRERHGAMRKGKVAGDPAVVGIVSGTPGVLLGGGLERIAAADPHLAARLDEARRLGDRIEEAELWADLEQAFETSHAPIALSGTVPCKVDAGYGAIRVGDLLTTSPTPGHAMRADDPKPGTVIGKALEPLEAGAGAIRVLVMLR